MLAVVVKCSTFTSITTFAHCADQALMKDLADATKRVSEKKRELDDISRQEKKVQELQSFLERLDADQQVADSEVSSDNFKLGFSNRIERHA